MTDLSKHAMLMTVRVSIVATVVVLASACVSAPVAPTATARPASPSLVAAPSATATRPAQRLTRPSAPYGGDPPILLWALPEAGNLPAPPGGGGGRGGGRAPAPGPTIHRRFEGAGPF